MDKLYDHKEYEGKIYELWEKSGAFTAKPTKNKKPFTIIMPPPNANDPLHVGHAREVATQDILTRYHRMRGEATLWLPGADHAGIETQFVFEKRLKEKGKSRFDFDRETLYKMVWKYVAENTGTMKKQLRQLGASCDWTRFKFTLDPEIVKIVNQTFKKLYDDNLVYRGEKIVNYCPFCGTSFSQLEINYVEQDSPLYFLDYQTITIATTRPETIFADVAIAVNPKDSRYQKLIGQKAVVPLVKREVPIIADSLVDKSFGTGALKVTPGHNLTDFEIGQKHKLPIISVIDEKGEMTNTPAKYIGLSTAKAREVVAQDLEKEGKLQKQETIHHSLGTCYRCHHQIEPLISKQWFLKVKPLVKLSLAAMKDKKVEFVSKRYEKIAKHWYKNLHDWNISRQIVWGIRIPAWRCEKCLAWTVTSGQTPKKCQTCQHTKLIQDSDTFDTWFSSGQWPYATLQSANPGDFEYFYPTNTINPAYDILPFWVIRMIMLGIYATGEIPFKVILLHGLVRDKYGVKISKSKGNVIDPIEMVDKYGADALRIASIWGSLVENDNSLSEDNVRGQRNFANKVWNIARFVLQDTKTSNSPKTRTPRSKNKDDQWILKELKITTKKITKALDKYRLNEASEELYDFIWHKFADVYLEKTKSRREEAQPILEYVLQESLKIAHPFLPFVTEVIWQQGFARDKQDLLISASWPK